MKIILTLCLLVSIHYSFSQTTLYGKAVRIIDGDTFELLTAEKTKYKIRLSDIDCPERNQDFGTAARQKLAEFIFGKEVKVVYKKLDIGKRVLGHVYFDNQYINLKMVESGMAWHFKKYSHDEVLASAEINARQQKAGIWSMKNPVAPWEFRKNEKPNRLSK